MRDIVVLNLPFFLSYLMLLYFFRRKLHSLYHVVISLVHIAVLLYVYLDLLTPSIEYVRVALIFITELVIVGVGMSRLGDDEDKLKTNASKLDWMFIFSFLIITTVANIVFVFLS